MIDAVTAAADAVTFLTPALIEIGKGSAKKVGETAADKLLSWLRTKTTGRASEALAELEAEPASADNQADLRKQLAKLLTQNPALLAELHDILPTSSAGGDRMEQHIEGAGAKGAQIKGSGNTVTM